MIHIKSLSSDDEASLSPALKFDIAFFGTAVDERGNKSVGFCQTRATTSHQLLYHPSDNEYTLDGLSTNIAALKIRIRSSATVLVECTTLGIVEIILVLRAARKEGISRVYFLYTEPGEYSRDPNQDIARATQFNLTGGRNFSAAHGVVVDLSLYDHAQIVFMLGYEDDRMAMLLTQQENLAPFEKHVIFGVPAFEAGWELNGFANHAGKLAADNFHLHYAAANSVSATYRALERIHSQIGESDNPVVIAPIGTKPHAIAAAIFLCVYCERNESGMIYDHPERKTGRSRDVRRWHLYSLT
ncbi:hypothetical protein [Paraburkholderia sediminicola]|uniref:hypothetical protein n=1 Tax=Paraburkholderia sediminicola TaxID=458836 RepID=UPI0038B90E07